MKTKNVLILCLGLVCLIATSGCSTTRTENGVTIEKQHSLNPLNYIPYL